MGHGREAGMMKREGEKLVQAWLNEQELEMLAVVQRSLADAIPFARYPHRNETLRYLIRTEYERVSGQRDFCRVEAS